MVFGIGTQELIVGAVLIGVVALFGKGLIIKAWKDWFSIKSEMKAIKDTHEQGITPDKVKAKKV